MSTKSKEKTEKSKLANLQLTILKKALHLRAKWLLPEDMVAAVRSILNPSCICKEAVVPAADAAAAATADTGVDAAVVCEKQKAGEGGSISSVTDGVDVPRFTAAVAALEEWVSLKEDNYAAIYVARAILAPSESKKGTGTVIKHLNELLKKEKAVRLHSQIAILSSSFLFLF
jgi:hypothetical protein